MAKFYYCIILLFYSINIINADSKNSTNSTNSTFSTKCVGRASSSSECFDKITEDEKEVGDHCCFFQAKDHNVQTSICVILEDETYSNLDDYISYQRQVGYEEVKIDCKSFYLSLSLFYLILILL